MSKITVTNILQTDSDLIENKNTHNNQHLNKTKYLLGKNIFQNIFFTWASPVLAFGYRNNIDQSSIPFLQQKNLPSVEYNKLDSKFKQNSKKVIKFQGWNLFRSLVQAFKVQILIQTICALLIVGAHMGLPVLSHYILEYIKNQNKSLNLEITYFISLSLLIIFLVIIQPSLWFYFQILGYNFYNAINLMIYSKALKHPLISEKQFGIGKIVNLSQVDAQRITYLSFHMVSIFYIPLQTLISIFLMYKFIGISFFVGFASTGVLMLFTILFTKIASHFSNELSESKDLRIKVAQQIFSNIQFIKINVLQKYFYRKINSQREKQLNNIKKINLCQIAICFLYSICPTIIISFTFLTYLWLGNQMTASQAFFIIIIVNIIQSPMKRFPTSVSQMIKIWASIKRIQKFLFSNEIKTQYIQTKQQINQPYAIQIQQGNFYWGKINEQNQSEKQQKTTKQSNNPKLKTKQSLQSFQSLQSHKQIITQQKKSSELENKYVKILHNINTKIPTGKVTMIIGNIGSGKSSLIYALLNQMTPQCDPVPKIRINGTITYSPQKPWIMSGTIKQNILLYQQYDQEKLKRAIHYSCLEDQLKILNKGIETEIGQKCVNLSGGQKARISLARALYSDKNIYLFDDILSAVDVHVGKFIMEETILKYLKNKTVIMPTHAIKFLDKADNVIVMEKGRIIAQGTYKQISYLKQFSEILNIEQKKDNLQKKQLQKQDDQILQNQKKENFQNKLYEQENQNQQGQNKSQLNHNNQLIKQLFIPEDRERGKVSFQVYKDYIKYNGGLIFIIGVLLFGSAWSALSIFSNISIEKFCQQGDNDRKYIYMYVGLAISGAIFSVLRTYILIIGGIKQARNLHQKSIKSLIFASFIQFFNKVPIGRILNRMSKNLRQIDQTLTFAMDETLGNLFLVVSSLIMCAYSSTPYIVILIVIITVILIKLMSYFLKTQRQYVRLNHIATSPLISGFTSAISGVSVIRAFRLQKQFIKQQLSKHQLLKRVVFTKQGVQAWICVRLGLFSLIINISALAYCIFSHNSNAALTGLLLTYSFQLTQYMISLAYQYCILQLKMISVQRMGAFTKIQPQIGYKEYSQNWDDEQSCQNVKSIEKSSIQFKNFSVKYHQKLPLIIKNASFKINEGQKIGIVGRTGAGKSTLINCLLRFIDPTEGSIQIGGQNIKQYPLKTLRQSITTIQQQPILMNDTFKMNFDPSSQYTQQQILQTLKKCNLQNFIQQKGGLNTIINNSSLSVGEKQLLCICRAFLKKNKIILIDQATANIDVKNDKFIQQAIKTTFRNSTVLTIAHRLSTLQNCDKILVLGNGEILQWGNRIQLKNNPQGIYYKMCKQNDKSYLQ